MGMLDLLYPKRCPVCLGALPPGKQLICEGCVKKLRLVRDPVCYRCGKPLSDPDKEYCGNCGKRMPEFIRGIAWAEYSSRYIRRMLSEVKYHEDPQLLDYPCMDFGGRKRAEVRSWGAGALIPVPVHEKRLRERGYNQAEEIARRLSAEWDIPTDADWLFRKENTVAQKKLSDRERLLNLIDAFEIRGERSRYETVILVDDIYTTGSTAIACTRTLMKAGVKKVYVNCLIELVGLPGREVLGNDIEVTTLIKF